jgi:hypothetical protein
MTFAAFNYVLDNVMTKTRENREGLDLNGLNHVLVYTDDINIPGENVNLKI